MRPVLYLLPGLLCDARVWAHQIGALSSDADVRVPDFRHYDSLKAMADAVLAEAPPRFSVVGHSMGGRVAQEITHRAPERVERLALFDTGTHGPRPEEREQRMTLVNLGFAEGMGAVAPRWLQPMMLEANWQDPAMAVPMIAMVERMTPDVYKRQTEALLGRPDATPWLAAVDCPTLVGVGREDRWATLAQHEQIVAGIRGARLVVFEQSGHMSPVEAAPAVSEALRAWLSN